MTSLKALSLMVVIGAVATGCAAPRYAFVQSPHSNMAGGPSANEAAFDDPRALPMFAGHDSAALSWGDLLDAVAWSEIIIIGEQHDDGMGHAVQLAVVEDTLDHWPRSVVSMEMLERDEQVLVDDYLDSIIDTPTFVRMTFSANWAGEGSWEQWFQPIIDAAKQRNAPVIAANAPRRYVRMARLQGYDALGALPRDRRALFDVPRSLPRDAYWERFGRVMSHLDSEPALLAMFRAQMLWDATMARSVLRARPSRQRKVVHLVGQFHSDFDGGTVQEIRRSRPGARILVISMQRSDATTLRGEDVNRADIVIYTGARREPDDPDDPDDPQGDDVHPDQHDPHAESDPDSDPDDQ